MTDVPLWVTITLPLVGYAFAVGTEMLRNHQQSARETKQRVTQRDESRQDRRDEFELNVLNDTYAALSRLARAAMRYHLADLQVAKKLDVKYASHQIGDVTGPELEEELRVAATSLGTQIQLLLDDEIRKNVASARDALLLPGSMYGSEVEDAKRAMDAAVVKVDQAQKLCGLRIRELYSAGPRQDMVRH